MSLPKKIALGVLALLVIIQLFRPEKNVSTEIVTADDISKKYAITEDVHQILIKKCYDCHSNNTIYPWYYNIQPVAWWMAHHVNDGKRHLNFSTFKTYSDKKAVHKMEELSEAVNDGWMPLDSYLWIHKEATITAADRDAINGWIKALPIVFEKEEDEGQH
ncbi:heme-binding domain-containing protein [Chryseolinea lacunae]|uniref:Heme-binding domain-containing protein n=1 Tax=Chryseolinea lacunae TaxID=2801331 RepID=A0ABS1KV98_9BACT|nr:heme-binding domain-containing protein [Chryseolinea lacunae]MBL0743370.1 heme-binding domain-containing protein [Chryseolinea lacunae]